MAESLCIPSELAKDGACWDCLNDDVMTWFWVGAHADYEKLIKR
jgi:hypothetical protein